MSRQSEWPPTAPSRPALTVTPDGYLRSDRSLAGPLRMGTAVGVGPSGFIPGSFARTDFGMDRITPRGFDPMGTSLERYRRTEGSRLLSGEIRRR